MHTEGGTAAGCKRPLAGPAEDWYCECRDPRTREPVLRPGRWRNCGACRAERPGT